MFISKYEIKQLTDIRNYKLEVTSYWVMYAGYNFISKMNI